jgi:hypothetical protein
MEDKVHLLILDGFRKTCEAILVHVIGKKLSTLAGC